MNIFPTPLNEQRQHMVKDIVSSISNRDTLVDFGCGSGMQLGLLVNFELVKKIIAVDQQDFVLKELSELLAVTDRDIDYPRMKPLTIESYLGDFLKFDSRLVGKDILMSIEVIEHLKITDVPTYTQLIFETYRPQTVIISTPNYDFNKMMGWNRFRNLDHKFEWTRIEFEEWSKSACSYGYSYEWRGCGFKDKEFATQFAIFTRDSDELSNVPLEFSFELYQKITYPHEK
eukprot:NODE_43_length_33755_cov_1.178542.p22 type:complete len:230 gc:universal NODE_43_length_33755_cov_1.178542:31072-30383(-)